MKTLSAHYRIILALFMAAVLTTACSDSDTPSTETETTEETSSAMPETMKTAPEEVTSTRPEASSNEPEEISGDETSAAAKTEIADGKDIYNSSCQICHATGTAGAPKLGDKKAWAPRIAKGMDTLFSSVLNGLNAMPPRGTCMNCSEDELRAAMKYIIEQSS
jgi:cytochrome c5